MASPRIYTRQPLTAGTQVELSDAAARHLLQVLRLKPGDPLTLFNGDGHDYPAILAEASKRRAVVALGQPGPIEPRQPLEIHLGLSISKGERMDFAIQKSVELGVARITPLISERTVVRLDATRLEKRLRHWEGVIISACEQCGRSQLPQLHPVTHLPEWIPRQSEGLRLLLDPRASQSLSELQPRDGKLTLMVGPEGGFSEQEMEQAKGGGFTGIRLGPRVLRTETAPLAAIAAAQTLWGDLR